MTAFVHLASDDIAAWLSTTIHLRISMSSSMPQCAMLLV